MRLELGTPVSCSDGPLGELADVVIDPTSRRVTHVVVRTDEPMPADRLVPTGLVAGERDGTLVLGCTVAEAHELEAVQELAFLRLGEVPVADPDWDIGVQEVLSMPYYQADYAPPADDVSVAYDRIPKGEVEIQRASRVRSSDGEDLGRVDGFIVDGDHITHLVLERGHLWTHREVTIPIAAVQSVENDEVTLNLRKQAVGKLPSVHVRRWPI